MIAQLRAEVLKVRSTRTTFGLVLGMLGLILLIVSGATTERVGEIAFAAGVPVHELATEGSSLEEIFLELTAEAQP